MNGILYFYNYTQPHKGVLGTAVLTDDKFTSFTGMVAEDMVETRRMQAERHGKTTSDVEIFTSLNGWTNGVLFAVDNPAKWE